MCRRDDDGSCDDEAAMPLVVDDASSSASDGAPHSPYLPRRRNGDDVIFHSRTGGSQKLRPFIGLLAAVGAACCMAGYALVGDEQIDPLRGRDASGFLLLRQVIASILMLLLCCCRHGTHATFLSSADAKEAFTPKQRNLVQALGVFQALNGICFVEGLSLSGAFVAAVCQLAIPVFTFAYAWAARLERPSALRTVAMMSIVVGCALTACGHGQAMHGTGAVHLHDESAADWRLAGGVALLLAQCASFVGILIVQKRVLAHHPVSLVLAWSYALAACWTLAYCVAAKSAFRLGRHLRVRHHHRELVVDYTAVSNIAFAALLGAVLYFELVGIATKHLPPTLVACTVTLEPLFVSLFGAFVLGRKTSTLEIGGYVFAALGAVAMSYLVREQESRGQQAVGVADASDSDSDGAHFRRSESGEALCNGDAVVTGTPSRYASLAVAPSAAAAPRSPRHSNECNFSTWK